MTDNLANDLATRQPMAVMYESRNPTRRWQHSTRKAWIESTLRRLVVEHKAERILEVGAATGAFLDLLSELGREVVASDLLPRTVEELTAKAAHLPNLQVVQDDITNSSLPANSFDLILCSQVTEHIPDSLPAIVGMRKLLRLGGALILSTPQKWSILERVAKIAVHPAVIGLTTRIYGEHIEDQGHVNLLTKQQVQDQLTQAGFRVVEQHVSGFYLPMVAEFGGESGLNVEKFLEARMRGTWFERFLNTQYHVAIAI